MPTKSRTDTVVSPTTLRAVLSEEQDGFRLVCGFVPERDWKGIAGFHPAEYYDKGTTTPGSIVVVTDPDLLIRAAQSMEAHPIKITELMMYVHLESGVAFKVGIEDLDSKPIRLLTEDDLDNVSNGKGTFKWRICASAEPRSGQTITRDAFAINVYAAVKRCKKDYSS